MADIRSKFSGSTLVLPIRINIIPFRRVWPVKLRRWPVKLRRIWRLIRRTRSVLCWVHVYGTDIKICSRLSWNIGVYVSSLPWVCYVWTCFSGHGISRFPGSASLASNIHTWTLCPLQIQVVFTFHHMKIRCTQYSHDTRTIKVVSFCYLYVYR